jgi:hypothetical protein
MPTHALACAGMLQASAALGSTGTTGEDAVRGVLSS